MEKKRDSSKKARKESVEVKDRKSNKSKSPGKSIVMFQLYLTID